MSMRSSSTFTRILVLGLLVLLFVYSTREHMTSPPNKKDEFKNWMAAHPRSSEAARDAWNDGWDAAQGLGSPPPSRLTQKEEELRTTSQTRASMGTTTPAMPNREINF